MVDMDQLMTELGRLSNEIRGVRFDVKNIKDVLPTNLSAIKPSEDCNTVERSQKKYRSLMRQLNLFEGNDLMQAAEDLVPQPSINNNWQFVWSETSVESDSYPAVQAFLKDTWGIDAVIVADGKKLADSRLLYKSDIFTLRPHAGGARTAELKVEGRRLEPHLIFRIKGRTDLAVFNKGAVVMTCSELLWAMEVKPKKKFSSPADINRALREGVLQLVGMNAANPYTSPSVVVTALTNQHFILHLEVEVEEDRPLRYHLRVKKTAVLATAIAFVQERAKMPSISSCFASPPSQSLQLFSPATTRNT